MIFINDVKWLKHMTNSRKVIQQQNFLVVVCSNALLFCSFYLSTDFFQTFFSSAGLANGIRFFFQISFVQVHAFCCLHDVFLACGCTDDFASLVCAFYRSALRGTEKGGVPLASLSLVQTSVSTDELEPQNWCFLPRLLGVYLFTYASANTFLREHAAVNSN